MFKYALQRLLYMVFVLLIITAMCFTLIRMLPVALLPPGDPHAAVIEAQREAKGYNEPIPVQFYIFLRDIFTDFDWGTSDALATGMDVWELFLEKLPASMA